MTNLFPGWPPGHPFPESQRDSLGGNAPDFPGSSGGREQGKFRPSKTPLLTQMAVSDDDGNPVGHTTAETLDEAVFHLRDIAETLALLSDTTIVRRLRDIHDALTDPGVAVEAYKALAAAANYAAGDVLSESATTGTAWKFENCAREAGASFWITGVQATCSEDSILARIRIHWFTAYPAGAELQDNAAFALVEANRFYYLSHTDLPAFADRGGFSATGDDTVRKMVTPAASSRSLWAIVEILDAEANETAANELRIRLQIERL